MALTARPYLNGIGYVPYYSKDLVPVEEAAEPQSEEIIEETVEPQPEAVVEEAAGPQPDEVAEEGAQPLGEEQVKGND